MEEETELEQFHHFISEMWEGGNKPHRVFSAMRKLVDLMDPDKYEYYLGEKEDIGKAQQEILESIDYLEEKFSEGHTAKGNK